MREILLMHIYSIMAVTLGGDTIRFHINKLIINFNCDECMATMRCQQFESV